jgi:uncharacterized protein
MSYWDSAAIIPLLIAERRTKYYSQLRDREEIVTWWGTPVECVSALARKFREQTLTPGDFAYTLNLLEQLAASWVEIQPSLAIRRTASQLLRTHSLRAGDALQLAAAQTAVNFHPERQRFLTEDVRLKAAAEREGFVVD